MPTNVIACSLTQIVSHNPNAFAGSVVGKDRETVEKFCSLLIAHANLTEFEVTVPDRMPVILLVASDTVTPLEITHSPG